MCSLGLNTRVKDKRNFIANLSYFYDEKRNIEYLEEDDKKKCEILNIPNSKTDFITGLKLTGIGDHYYPLCADIKKFNRIGSDSLWNRIPVSGSNLKYKKNKEYHEKLDAWINYVQHRGALLYYTLTEEDLIILKDLEEELVKINETKFKLLCDKY